MPTKNAYGKVQSEDIVRLPLVSTYNTRNIDNTNTSITTSSIVGFGLVGVLVVGNTASSIKDKKLINCFAEKVQSPLTGSSEYYVTKRPGFAVLNTPASGELGSALKVWSINADKVISSFGSTNSTIYDGTTSIGTVTGVTTFLEETLLAATPYLTAVTTSNKAYYSTGGAFTEITDVDFPSNASRTITGNFVFIDGYAFIMDTGGRIYNSDLNSISAWTADSFISANMYPDNGIGLARYKNLLMAFGKETIEFFYNSGQNPVGSPMSRYEQGFVHFGALNQYAFTQLEDTVAWVSASDRSGIATYILDGLQPKRVSTPYIDSQLSLASTSGVYVTSAKIVGKTWIIITTTGATFVYIVEDDMWHEWQSTLPIWHHMSGTSAGTRVSYAISRSDTGGKVFVIDPSNLTYQDNGTTYTMTIQTSKYDANTINWKFLNKLSLVGDTCTIANTMSISWSDNDYQSFSTPRDIDLYTNNPYIMNCGKFRRRAFKLSNTVNAPVRLEALELQLRQGIH